MNFLRELGQFLRFFWRTPAEHKRIVFYAENAGYHAYLEGLVNELVDRRNEVIAYVTSDPRDPILSDSRPGLRSFYLRSLLPYFMILVKCRVFVMTLTDLHRFHLKRSMHPVHYVYVFHSLVSTHMMYREGAFDHYDSILCPGPHHMEEIRECERAKGLPTKQLIRAGYYRLERINREYLQHVREKPDAGPATILIAPSWGEHHLLKEGGEDLTAALLDAGYRVIVRPHPETVRREPGLLTRLEQAFAERQNFILERSVRTDTSLLEADLLICDLSGVALEYALGTERPVLFVDLPPKVQNPVFTELGREPIELALRSELGELMPPGDPAGALERVARLLADRDRYQSKLAGMRERLIFNFGHSPGPGADHILEVASGSAAERT